MKKAYAAEFLGTFLLAFVVRLAIGSQFGVPTAVLAGMTLGLGVYMFGPVSGAHLNPAVTIGLASVKKISVNDAALYIVAQLLGGFLAGLAGTAILSAPSSLVAESTLLIGLAEAMGAAVLVLGVSSVVFGKTPAPAAGLAIGTALTLGASIASVLSNGVVNPAVALGIGSVSVAYILGPIVGGILAAWGYRAIVK